MSRSVSPHSTRIPSDVALQFHRCVRSCHGHSYQTAGLLMAFFADPAPTKVCAEQLKALGVSVEVSGCQLVIGLHGGWPGRADAPPVAMI